MEAKNLTELFSNKIFRIPDYQRGYAWKEKQLNEFWDDIDEIRESNGELKKHYMGTIYLEATKPSNNESWLSDYTFYNVVDGQQRLTTISILLFELLRATEIGYNERSKSKLIETFIVEENLSGNSKVYKFGYVESDNNSSFLLNTVFEDSEIPLKNNHLNLYRKNLIESKEFFRKKIDLLQSNEKELIFKKLTNSLQFDMRTIEEDLDVQAVFETMNNRGKPLSTLEKLKNRLIYLTEKLPGSNEDRVNLRNKINTAWGNIYTYLAQNPDYILDEDVFLSAHLSLYRTPKESTFSEKLAEEKVFKMFCNKSEKYDFDETGIKEEPVTYGKIQDYVLKISELSPIWYDIHNTSNKKIKKILLMNGSKEIKIFLATIKLKFIDNEDVVLDNLEKILFRNKVPGIGIVDERRPANWARELYSNESSLDDIMSEMTRLIYTPIDNNNIINSFKHLFNYVNGNKGFHRWWGLKYFLFEYEDYLKDFVGETNDKVTLSDYNDTTIEHIIPQNFWPNWSGVVNDFTNMIEGDDEKNQARKVLINTLGNLTILKNGKNSSLGDRSWSDKKGRYSTGSYNEITISQNVEWTKMNIYKRGFDMLKFMESKVQNLNLSDDDKKQILFYDEYIIKQFNIEGL